LINHATFGFNRWRSGTNPAADRFGWPAKIGLTGVNPKGLFPWLNINFMQDYGNNVFNSGAQKNFDANEGLSWIKGKHTFKFGFEYLKSQSNDVTTGGDAVSLPLIFQQPACLALVNRNRSEHGQFALGTG